MREHQFDVSWSQEARSSSKEKGKKEGGGGDQRISCDDKMSSVIHLSFLPPPCSVWKEEEGKDIFRGGPKEAKIIGPLLKDKFPSAKENFWSLKGSDLLRSCIHWASFLCTQFLNDVSMSCLLPLTF